MGGDNDAKASEYSDRLLAGRDSRVGFGVHDSPQFKSRRFSISTRAFQEPRLQPGLQAHQCAFLRLLTIPTTLYQLIEELTRCLLNIPSISMSQNATDGMKSCHSGVLLNPARTKLHRTGALRSSRRSTISIVTIEFFAISFPSPAHHLIPKIHVRGRRQTWPTWPEGKKDDDKLRCRVRIGHVW